MGDVLAELEDSLRNITNKYRMTPSEETFLRGCKTRALRAFTAGSCISFVATWAAARSLPRGQRFHLSVGSAVLAGAWRFNRSLNGCVDQILGLEGSRMQWALASIILNKHNAKTSKVELVRKYFFPEQVFNDLSPDKPFFRWRPRSIFVEDNSAIQRTEKVEYDDDHEERPEETGQRDTARNNSVEASAQRRIDDDDMTTDPLDWIFGHQDSNQATGSSGRTGALPRRQLREQRKAHRRNRAHHRGTPAESRV